MTTKSSAAAIIIASAVLILCFVGRGPMCNGMSIEEARQIAIEKGFGDKMEGIEVCHEEIGRWWLDLNLAAEDNCDPALVINTTSGESRINWRCFSPANRTDTIDWDDIWSWENTRAVECQDDSDCKLRVDHCTCSNECIRANHEPTDCAVVCDSIDTSVNSCGCVNWSCAAK